MAAPTLLVSANFEIGEPVDEISFDLITTPTFRTLEPSGRGFHQIVMDSLVATEKKQEELAADDGEHKINVSKILKEKNKTDDDEFDYYELFGLEKLRNKATQDHIKKAYKVACMTFHPDQNMTNGVPDDTMFKRVQTAWDVLSNPRKRIGYDSSGEFNDSIPAYFGDESKFYVTFGPVFERWTKWSHAALPALGDDNTKYSDVEAFYKSWANFKSWRDFSFDDEYDIEDAENREEKRWMERNNEKVRLEKKNNERKKFVQIYELAKKSDPRILNRRRQQEEEKKKRQEKQEEEKMKKLVAQAKKEEEYKLQQEEEKRKIAEEKMNASQEQERIKREDEATRRRFRDLCAPYSVMSQMLTKKQIGNKILAEHVEFIVARSDAAELNAKNEQLSAATEAEPFVQILNDMYEHIKKNNIQVKVGIATSQQTDNKSTGREWTTKELAALTKAIKQFPGGVSGRWNKISKAVGTRTAQEVQEKTTEIRNNAAAGIPQTSNKEHFEDFSKAKENGATKKKEQEDKMNEQYKEQLKTTSGSVKDVENWNNEQQKALENALKTHKDVKGEEKWVKIAEELGNKTKEQCKERFEHCKKLVQAKKK
ncbi:DnaJ [Acrasis kona]|uniref:DnaJ n=1 Tax=Acrasis kona TaxID=1008807 RepID=A0AAW2YZV7_9EUKA